MKTANKIWMTVGVAMVCASSATGCARDEDGEDDDVASASVTSALQASQSGGLNQDLTDVDADAAVDPARAADFIANRRGRGLSPEGCMTRTKGAGNTVHVVFADCTGPFGKLRLNGSADVSFELDAQKRLVAKIVGGSDLTANDRPLTYRATGTLEHHGDVRDVTWHAEASGKTKRGKEYSRSTDVSLSVDVAKRCLQGSGVAKGTIGGFDLELTIDDLAVCEDACPTRGNARASVKGRLGRERAIEVVFDGTDHAKVTTPRGKELSVKMACADGESAE